MTIVYGMSSNPVKSEDNYSKSPASVEPVQLPMSPAVVVELENDISPESVSAISRKESHRASERVRCVFLL